MSFSLASSFQGKRLSASEILAKYAIAEESSRGGRGGGRKGKKGGKRGGKFGGGRSRSSSSSSSSSSRPPERPLYLQKTAAMLQSATQGVVLRKENTFATVAAAADRNNIHAGKSAAELQAEITALKATMAKKPISALPPPKPLPKRALPPPPKRL